MLTTPTPIYATVDWNTFIASRMSMLQAQAIQATQAMMSYSGGQVGPTSPMSSMQWPWQNSPPPPSFFTFNPYFHSTPPWPALVSFNCMIQHPVPFFPSSQMLPGFGSEPPNSFSSSGVERSSGTADGPTLKRRRPSGAATATEKESSGGNLIYSSVGSAVGRDQLEVEKEMRVTRKVKGQKEDKEDKAMSESESDDKLKPLNVIDLSTSDEDKEEDNAGIETILLQSDDYQPEQTEKPVKKSRQAQELELMEELREMAMGLKKRILQRFKICKSAAAMLGGGGPKGGKRLWKQSSPHTNCTKLCTYPNCSFTCKRPSHLKRHLGSHYPDAYFCPVCLATFSYLSAFERHLIESRRVDGRCKSKKKSGVRGKTGTGTGMGVTWRRHFGNCEQEDLEEDGTDVMDLLCVESEDALRFEVGRDKERFNVYHLGVMEDYEMSDEHFEILAGRRREHEQGE